MATTESLRTHAARAGRVRTRTGLNPRSAMPGRWTLALLGMAPLLGSPTTLAQTTAPFGSLESSVQLQGDASDHDRAHKRELIASVLSQRQGAAGRRFSPALHSRLLHELLPVPTAALEAFGAAGGTGSIAALNREAAGAQAAGGAAADLVFTPVAPCRIINTVVTGTPLAANTRRAFQVSGGEPGVFEAQGGAPGGCNIPDTARAVEMNFIAVAPVSAGNLRAFPWHPTPTVPNASVINYASVAGLNVANGLAQPVCDPVATICAFDLFVQADVAQTHVVVDVVGYYDKADPSPVRSFVVSNRGEPGAAFTPTCSNAGGLTVTVNAPVPGRVAVLARAILLINHTTGGPTQVHTSIGTSATECSTDFGYTSGLILPSAWPTMNNYATSELAFKTFDVPAGSRTFFLNSLQISGPPGSFLAYLAMEATFFPD
jgi:hypothetical protein